MLQKILKYQNKQKHLFQKRKTNLSGDSSKHHPKIVKTIYKSMLEHKKQIKKIQKLFSYLSQNQNLSCKQFKAEKGHLIYYEHIMKSGILKRLLFNTTYFFDTHSFMSVYYRKYENYIPLLANFFVNIGKKYTILTH